MENTENKLGYLSTYEGGKWIEEWVSREDLAATDQNKKDLVQSWIVGLMKPWCASAEFFNISRNCSHDEKIVDENEAWRATYTSIFYDTLESVIVAYGATPSEALANVEKILNEMLKIYEDK